MEFGRRAGRSTYSNIIYNERLAYPHFFAWIATTPRAREGLAAVTSAIANTPGAIFTSTIKIPPPPVACNQNQNYLS